MFENYDQNSILSFTNYIPILDRFTLKAFNSLFYNWKINISLILVFY